MYNTSSVLLVPSRERHSFMFYIVFSFWSFEISEGIRGFQKIIKRFRFISVFGIHFELTSSCVDCPVKLLNYSIFSDSFCQSQVYRALLTETAVWSIFLLNIITARSI